jgi:glycosyltransferase involved in cell wall biosynthesis
LPELLAQLGDHDPSEKPGATRDQNAPTGPVLAHPPIVGPEAAPKTSSSDRQAQTNRLGPARPGRGRAEWVPVHVAMTIEQCWHRVPGGTAVAALRTLDELVQLPDLTITGVGARHRHEPIDELRPPISCRTFPLPQPLLYDLWARTGRPRIEGLVPEADVVHATTILVPPSRKPLVVTIHDLAFLHEPGRFTARGNRLFRASLDIVRRSADLVLCSSDATKDDCVTAGIGADRLRVVPLGVRAGTPAPASAFALWRQAHNLAQPFLLFVGTLEPRKNLSRLLDAFALLSREIHDLDLVVVGPSGWGEAVLPPAAIADRVRMVGRVPDDVLVSLYREAVAVCYPSLSEGFGLPILEAMVNGAPVVTSRGSSTEEVAGNAAVLVDPLDASDIARGIRNALGDRDRLIALGGERAALFSWRSTAARTNEAYRDVSSR